MRYFGNDIKLFVNNLVVSYTDQGSDDAPVIIFIHGFPLNKTMWNYQIEALMGRFRVIAYDIRGHGNSDVGNDYFSIDLFANDLIQFMDMLKIKKASLCGLSMGGYIALNAIENYPERFDALVLSDTNCMVDSPEVKEKRMKSIHNILENGVSNYADESVKNLFAQESFSTHEDEIISVKEMICNTSEESLGCTLLALAARNGTCSKLFLIDVPVLILVGEEDKITPPKVSLQMHESIKDSIMYIIPHAAHLSNMEQPEQYNEQLMRFFAQVYKTHEVLNSEGSNSIFVQMREKVMMLLSINSI